MRTTLTIDDDLAAILERERKRKGLSFKEIVNISLRRGLASEELVEARPEVLTRPHAFGYLPGIKPDKLNQLCDELEVEAYLEKEKRLR